MGNVPALHVSHPDVVKDINLCLSLDLGKATYLKKAHEPLFGHGILKSNGVLWAHQRKIIAPEFFLDKVKVSFLYNYIQNNKLKKFRLTYSNKYRV